MESLSPRCRALALAVLCYNEHRFTEWIPFIVPGAKFRFDLHRNGSFFHGVVLDESAGHIYPVFRGTDADNYIGKIVAWYTNFNMLTGLDGIHNGFQQVVEDALKEYAPYYAGVISSMSVGHSQGGGTAKINALRVAEEFRHLIWSRFEVYADPPSGNEVWSSRCDAAEETDRFGGDRYIVPGDPIDTHLFRQQHSILFDGVDVGTTHKLPSVLGPHENSPLGVFAHSPRAYVFAKMWEELRKLEISVKIDEEYLESLSWILWKCDN